MCIAFLACLLPVFLIIIICSLFKHHVCYSNHCKSQHSVLYLSLLVKTLFGVIYCFNFLLSFSLHQNTHYPIMWTEFLVQNSLHVINWGPSLWPILLISSAAVHPLIDVTWISRVWIWISLCYRSSQKHSWWHLYLAAQWSYNQSRKSENNCRAWWMGMQQ